MPFLPLCPDLNQYRTQAKELLAACAARNPEALARIADHRSRGDGPILSDAQLNRVLDPGDPDRVRAILAEVPQLADCVSWPKHRPGVRAIEIVSSACVWHRPLKHEVEKSLANVEPT
ncbi:MAG: hypothetical protein ACI906_005230 [Candidatus Latescibacterota bacterium]|jgi:hypothetical protein